MINTPTNLCYPCTISKSASDLDERLVGYDNFILDAFNDGTFDYLSEKENEYYHNDVLITFELCLLDDYDIVDGKIVKESKRSVVGICLRVHNTPFIIDEYIRNNKVFQDVMYQYHVIKKDMTKEQFINLLDFITGPLYKSHKIEYDFSKDGNDNSLNIVLGWEDNPRAVICERNGNVCEMSCGLIEKYDLETVNEYISTSTNCFNDYFHRFTPDELFDHINGITYRRFFKAQLGQYLVLDYGNFTVEFGKGSGYCVNIYYSCGKSDVDRISFMTDLARECRYEKINTKLFGFLDACEVDFANYFGDDPKSRYEKLYNEIASM